MIEKERADFGGEVNYDSLEVIYGDLYPIEDTFALVSHSDTKVMMTQELYSDQRRERIIVAPHDSPVAAIHEALQDQGVSLLDGVVIDENIVFIVPKNTRTIESVAALIEDAFQEQHDTTHYMPIFRLLGRELSLLQSAGIGVPAVNALQQFAFSPRRDAEFGGRVMFLPPYMLNDADVSAEHQLAQLKNLLISGDSPVSTESVIEDIIEEVARGRQER